MGDPTSSYATAGIAPRVIGVLKPPHHDKVETPRGNFASVDRNGKSLRYQIWWKSIHWEPSSFKTTSRQTNRHEEANCRFFSQFFQSALKQSYWLHWHWHRDVGLHQTRPPTCNAWALWPACSVAWQLTYLHIAKIALRLICSFLSFGGSNLFLPSIRAKIFFSLWLRFSFLCTWHYTWQLQIWRIWEQIMGNAC
jgi:hypothetical protein